MPQILAFVWNASSNSWTRIAFIPCDLAKRFSAKNGRKSQLSPVELRFAVDDDGNVTAFGQELHHFFARTRELRPLRFG